MIAVTVGRRQFISVTAHASALHSTLRRKGIDAAVTVGRLPIDRLDN